MAIFLSPLKEEFHKKYPNSRPNSINIGQPCKRNFQSNQESP